MPQFIYHHGYAVPDYVKREPSVPRGGTYITAQRPRGTYDAGKPGFSLGLGGETRGCWSCACPTEQPVARRIPVGSDAAPGPDPISDFGNNVANMVLKRVAPLPKAERAYALEVIFGQIEPGLWQEIKARKAKLVAGGMPADPALRKAIAAATSRGLLAEFDRAGRMGVIKPTAMGFFNPFSWAAKQAGRAGSAIKGAVKDIGKFACKVASSDAGVLAAGAAGGPAAAAGAKLSGGLCPPGMVAVPPPPPPQPFPILPVALIAGAAVVAIVVLD